MAAQYRVTTSLIERPPLNHLRQPSAGPHYEDKLNQLL